MSKFLLCLSIACLGVGSSTSLFAARTKTIKTVTETTKTTKSIPQAEAFTIINGESDTFDFGTSLEQGIPVKHVFHFKNNGSTDLQIRSVSSTCGCTTPEWDGNIIPPGKTGSVVVLYNAAARGKFYKAVTITFADNSKKALWIKGGVVSK